MIATHLTHLLLAPSSYALAALRPGALAFRRRNSAASMADKQLQQPQQNTEPGTPPVVSKSQLEAVDTHKKIELRNQILREQAQRGEQPGLMLMQDAMSGEKKAQRWGNEETNVEPEHQN